MPLESIILKLISTVISPVPIAQAPVPYGPSSPPKPPDPWDMFTQGIFDSFGVPGLIGVAVAVFLIGVVLWQWEKVHAVQGSSWLLRRVRRRRLPKYDPKRYGVAVLRLQDDKSDIWRTRIVEDLEEFSGIESRALDRCIGLDIHAREDSETEGHALARTFLKGTGASVAIWGRVIGEGEASRAKLYFTTVSKGVERYNRYGVAENQRLPELFWADLINILNLIISTGYVQFHEAQGKYIADELVPFIGRVKQVVQDQQKLLKWTGEQRHRVNVVLGNALSTLGEQKRQRGPLLEAARAFREALVACDRKFVPLHWALVQNNLGTVLANLGEADGDTWRIREAIDCCRKALEEWSREKVPFEWAMAQNNLGIALSMLGQRERRAVLLAEAVAAFRKALEVFKPEGSKYHATRTQANLSRAEHLLRRLRGSDQ